MLISQLRKKFKNRGAVFLTVFYSTAVLVDGLREAVVNAAICRLFFEVSLAGTAFPGDDQLASIEHRDKPISWSKNHFEKVLFQRRKLPNTGCGTRLEFNNLGLVI